MAYELKLYNLDKEVYGDYHPWFDEHVANGLPTAVDLDRLQEQIVSAGYLAYIRYAGNFQQQCRIFEHSLFLINRLGRLGRPGDFYHLFASLAQWHKMVFHDQPSEKRNRFYLISQVEINPGSTCEGKI